MKKILQISNYMYPHIGGIEQVARDVMNAISLEGTYEQRVICFNENAEAEGIINVRKQDTVDFIDGVEIIRCRCFAKISSQSLSYSYYYKLKEVLSDFHPDIVILHYPNPFVSFLLERFFKYPFKLIIYWHLDITKQKILKKFFVNQTKRLISRAEVIIATSPLYIEGSNFLTEAKEKCVIIPNCIRKERFSITDKITERANEIRGSNADKIICFSIGRHVEYKGFEYLVQASKKINHNVVIAIGGSGPLTDKLEKMAEGDSRLLFLGKISDEELCAWYLAMDILVFPSITKNEAFGISLAEGMWFGKPAVTFNIPGSGVNYVSLNGVTGVECKSKDSLALANAINKLASNDLLRNELGLNAMKRVNDLFLFETFRSRIVGLIDSIL